MSKEREIRKKIASIKNTQKITKAMELVATRKMRTAQNRMIMSRPYSSKIYEVIGHIAASHAEYTHPYLGHRETIQSVGYIVVTTDRGLCGGLNINLLRMATEAIHQWKKKDIKIDLYIIGRKGESFFQRCRGEFVSALSCLGDDPEIQDLIKLIKVMLDRFDKKKIDAIYIASNRFVNSLVQKPSIRQLLPWKTKKTDKKYYWDYIYEPDTSKELLEMLLVRYVESQVHQAIIENIACEHSARRTAMKNATDNSEQLIDELQIIYNKARQSWITQEITEIVTSTVST
ncbi:F0F1 ATP synthase subunit gamma [Coxiella endosymbiont of Amblyomma sculptum]|uniref:F0F1 ATP synthase subunit gamma n=1 Tax=Coxiella endosymbiont of Amblyomma sculptum TaxID=2487929 RepID=UPI00132EF288|nr:F0F1 ATP synthase subunit gamma [Coxiella endosymbiont of Amblyomma sculptum]QHG92209.1 F0F1 ATP synthase subunit gamma [Coxiella endosymbiont of Amblyomma sculptum]